LAEHKAFDDYKKEFLKALKKHHDSKIPKEEVEAWKAVKKPLANLRQFIRDTLDEVGE
jgi:hypothetical protein